MGAALESPTTLRIWWVVGAHVAGCQFHHSCAEVHRLPCRAASTGRGIDHAIDHLQVKARSQPTHHTHSTRTWDRHVQALAHTCTHTRTHAGTLVSSTNTHAHGFVSCGTQRTCSSRPSQAHPFQRSQPPPFTPSHPTPPCPALPLPTPKPRDPLPGTACACASCRRRPPCIAPAGRRP